MNAPVVEACHCEVETITPLHVGSGEVYQPGLEFFEQPTGDRRAKTLKILPRNWLRQIEGDLTPRLVEELAAAIDKNSLQAWLAKGDTITRLARHTLHLGPNETAPSAIREQIHDAMGAPLLPGSSLKGALRTAIVSHLLEDKEIQELLQAEVARLSGNKFDRGALPRVSEPFLKGILGSDPKYDLMRTLRVGDIAFEIGDLALQKVKTLTLSTASLFKPKGYLNVVEALKPGARAAGMLSFDRYLQDNAEGKCDSLFRFRIRLDREKLLVMLRNLADRHLTEEIAFLDDKNGEFVKQLRAQIMELRKQARSLGPDEALLNCGWGVGWNGMTGGLISQHDLDANGSALRKSLQLASIKHYLHFPFPKSRRVAQDGHNAWPMGWIRLTMHPHKPDAARGHGRAYWSRSSSQAALAAKAPAPPAFETVEERWEGALLDYSPGNGELTANHKGRKAMAKGLDLVPEQKRKKLKKDKELKNCVVTVSISGNSLRIVKIECG